MDNELEFIDGTKDGKNYRFFNFNPQIKLNAQIDFILKNKVNEIRFSKTEEKFIFETFGLLKNTYANIKSIIFDDIIIKDLDFLIDFQNIERLFVVTKIKNSFDFNKLKKLKYLIIYMGKYFSLENINKNIISLTMHQSTITEIEEIGKLSELKELGIMYFPKLKNISSIIKCMKLEYLGIKNCKSITTWNEIKNCKSLNNFFIENCGTIPTIQFLKDLNINKLRIVNTKIEDGKVKWLLKKELEINNFPVYKSYDIVPEELWEYNESRIE
jgi:hypothetical protein